MSKSTKIWLITATSLIFIGLVSFVSLMSACDWDFTELGTVKHETNTYEINEEFSNISINADTEDIVFLPSDDGKSKVVCIEETNLKHSVAVENGTLVVDRVNERKWYDYIGVNIGSSEITVYIPQEEYAKLSVNGSTGDVSITDDFGFASIGIKASTGTVRVENVSADSLEIAVSTGRVTVSDVDCKDEINVGVSTGEAVITDTHCKTFISNGNTGEIYLKNVLSDEKFDIERSTGDVEFENCDAHEIYIKTDTGDVEGSLLSGKTFVARSGTGDIEVPKSTNGGRCEITTDTGDIEIDIR